MRKTEIGIVLIATNAYFVLGLRFIRRFIHFYDGNCRIRFYFFSDTNPIEYLPGSAIVEYHPTYHVRWVDGTNSKFRSILSLKHCPSDFLYYFDADTNIQKQFNEEWMIGELVGGEHYSNKTTLCCGEGFDRNPNYNSYVSKDSKLPYTYHYGAFFGGIKDNVMEMCQILEKWQSEDKKRGYEAPVNDESYINKYFHFNSHHTVSTQDFAFVVSDKGGLGNTRQRNLDISQLKEQIKEHKEDLWDIQYKKFSYEQTDRTNMVG